MRLFQLAYKLMSSVGAVIHLGVVYRFTRVTSHWGRTVTVAVVRVESVTAKECTRSGSDATETEFLFCS